MIIDGVDSKMVFEVITPYAFFLFLTKKLLYGFIRRFLPCYVVLFLCKIGGV